MTSVFDISRVRLDLDEVESVQEANATILRLAERRKTEITVAGPLAQSKLTWKVAVYQQAILYRVVMLASGAASAWNDGNTLTSFLAARALVETVAVVSDFAHQLRAFLAASDLKSVNELVMNRTFATRDEVMLAERPGTQSVNVLTLIDKLDAAGLSGVRGHYDIMSERSHPNSMGHHQMFAITDKVTGTVTFTTTKRLELDFRHLFAGAFLVRLVESTMDELDKLVLDVAELQHRSNPVHR